MGNNSTEQYFPRTARHVRASGEWNRRRNSKARMPSSFGYLLAAIAAAVALFFALWWMFVSGGDEAPWIPAGLAASVVLLVALSAREVVMRRAWTRYLLEQGVQESSPPNAGPRQSTGKVYSTTLLSNRLRAIQKQAIEADANGSVPDAHLDIYHLCRDYLNTADEALQSSTLTAEKRVTLRSGQERARALQKHHLLKWARDASRSLTHEAQQRARTSDKIETANRAIDCLESALKVYPEEIELRESQQAIREFIASVKVAHWVEMAERSAFKGHHKRAIERYKDALFYLNREAVKEEVRVAGSERIEREIASLQARLKAAKIRESGSTAASIDGEETDQ